MQLDDRFDDLVESLTGFHRTWLIYLGVELGLFSKLRAAGQHGLTAAELAGLPAPMASDLPSGAWLLVAELDEAGVAS